MTKGIVSFVLSLTVLAWSVRVMAGYAADRASHYVGETPMAFNTAACLALLSIVGMLLSKHWIQDADE